MGVPASTCLRVAWRTRTHVPVARLNRWTVTTFPASDWAARTRTLNLCLATFARRMRGRTMTATVLLVRFRTRARYWVLTLGRAASVQEPVAAVSTSSSRANDVCPHGCASTVTRSPAWAGVIVPASVVVPPYTTVEGEAAIVTLVGLAAGPAASAAGTSAIAASVEVTT